jgi:hypothetical protein
MQVIAHQAIRVQLATCARQETGQVKEIKGAVLILKKARRSVVAAVNHVHRYPGQH